LFCVGFLFIACGAIAGATPPELITLKQSAPPARKRTDLPKGAVVGPTIPGLLQGATPQGLAFLEPQQWLLITCYFNDGRPSVLVAIDRASGHVVRCLTLLDENESPHTGHVGGLALSERHVWVGSGAVYRVTVEDVVAARPVDYLRIKKVFRAECTASYLAFNGDRLWVGEFVIDGNESFAGCASHRLLDRQGRQKHAWACAYALDDEENVVGAGGQEGPEPNAVISTRQSVHGMAFFGNHIVVSTSYGKSDSLLGIYRNPLLEQGDTPHAKVRVGGSDVPLWFLDGQNHVGKDIPYPPRAEGIATVGDSLAVCSR
jgi:hypothetical protein